MNNEGKEEIIPDIKPENVTYEKVKFAYDNGIAYLEEIKNGNRVLNTRVTLLLGYLAVVIGFLINYMVDDLVDKNLNKWSFYIIGSSLGFFLGIFLSAVKKLIDPTTAKPTYSKPKRLLNVINSDLNGIIFSDAINRIEGHIQSNLTRQKDKKHMLTKYINLTIYTMIGLVIALILRHFLVLFHHYLLLV